MSELDLPALASRIERPDSEARSHARERQDQLVKPPGSLGRLEELSVWLAGVQGSCPTRPIRCPRVVIFAGDHGVARAGVSAYPPEVTAQMVGTFIAGGGAVNVLARLVGAEVRVVDLAVDDDLLGVPESVRRHKIRRGSGRIDREDALTREEAEQAFRVGLTLADEEADSGADLLVPGDMGIGNTTPAAVIIGALAGWDAAAVMGRGSGIDDQAWIRKCAIVRDALRRARPVIDDPIQLLATAGGADFAAMTGFLVQAAVRRTPVLLDGVVSAAAALVAHRVAFRAVHWWLAGHLSTEPAHAKALERLAFDPLVRYELRLGEGTGALLAVPLIKAAGATLAEMATFREGHVSTRVAPPARDGGR
ncbi:MAG: nicotinate-nucleotide--dimethylbenzimidazole phosphoribosyltransferase [Streptomycetales bacterium]